MEIPYIVNARKDTGLNNSKIAIWLFLASEVMLFGGLFSSYIFLRIFADYPWPERVLPVLPGLLNTFILIGSSITVVYAWAGLKLRNWKMFKVNMSITLICALVFMVFKGFEYKAKFAHQGVQYNDWTVVEGHTHGDNSYVMNVKSINFDLTSYYEPYLDEILENIGDNEMRITSNYVTTVVNEKENSYTEELIAKEGQVVNAEELKDILEDAKDYYIEARIKNQNVRADALRLAWKEVRANKDGKFISLVGKSHHEPEYKSIVNKHHGELLAANATGSQLAAVREISIDLLKSTTITKDEENLESLAHKGIYAAGNIVFDDKSYSTGDRFKYEDLKTLLTKVDEVPVKVSVSDVKINPDWGRMTGKKQGSDATVKLKDSTVITGASGDSGLGLDVDAIDFRHMVMKLREKIEEGVEDATVIDKAIAASPILNIEGKHGDDIRLLWADHKKWVALFREKLSEKDRVPTDLDVYRITWKQMVAYNKIRKEGLEFTLDNVKANEPGMFVGFTGANHTVFNPYTKDDNGNKVYDEANRSFPLITIPREEIRFESVFSPKMNNYYAIYFTISGLHGLHVIGGAIVLGYYLFFGRKMYDENPEWLANRVEVGGLFWHFVDLVWIFVFPIFYLM